MFLKITEKNIPVIVKEINDKIKATTIELNPLVDYEPFVSDNDKAKFINKCLKQYNQDYAGLITGIGIKVDSGNIDDIENTGSTIKLKFL